jgi:hypothetical protein
MVYIETGEGFTSNDSSGKGFPSEQLVATPGTRWPCSWDGLAAIAVGNKYPGSVCKYLIYTICGKGLVANGRDGSSIEL